MDAKKQILEELGDIESAIANLKGSEASAQKQTDLEIAILRQQIAKRDGARAKIDGALKILEALQ